MSLPLVTRFGADPILDLEVANKRYVDTSTAGFFTGSFNINNQNSTSLRFFGFGATITELDENETVSTFPFACTGVRMQGTLANNQKIAGNTLIVMRDDGVDVIVVTIAFGLTGNFVQDGTAAIAAESEIAFNVDTLTQGTQTLRVRTATGLFRVP